MAGPCGRSIFNVFCKTEAGINYLSNRDIMIKEHHRSVLL